MKNHLLISCSFVLASCQMFAQTNAGTWFILRKVSNHVFAAIPKKSARLNSTSSIIVGKHFITVVEAQSDEHASEMLLKQIRSEISSLPVKYLLLTHYHIDHTGGANAFLRENPQLAIGGSPELYNQLKTKAVNQKKEFLDFIKTVSDGLRKKSDTTENNSRKNILLATNKEFLDYYNDIDKSKLVLPQMLIRDTLTILDDSLEIKYFTAGASHTPADMAVYIPGDKILISGDLVHDFQPLVWGDSDPQAWIRTLTGFERLDINTIIGGHGRPKPKETIELWKNYLTEIISLVSVARKNNLTLTQLKQQVSSHSLMSLSNNNFGKEVQQAIHLNMDDAYNFNWDETIHDVLATIWNSMEATDNKNKNGSN